MKPGSDPVVSSNSATAKMILGERFLKMTFKGTMFGTPFDGLQIVGYDNLQKKFVTFWIDSTSTSFYLLTGTLNDAEKVIIDTGEWPDPMAGGTVKVRAVTKLINENEYVYELFMVGSEGGEFKSLENVFLRKK
jgi:hypothetical protein